MVTKLKISILGHKCVYHTLTKAGHKSAIERQEHLSKCQAKCDNVLLRYK